MRLSQKGFCLFFNKSERVCAQHIAENRSQNSNILKPPKPQASKVFTLHRMVLHPQAS